MVYTNNRPTERAKRDIDPSITSLPAPLGVVSDEVVAGRRLGDENGVVVVVLEDKVAEVVEVVRTVATVLVLTTVNCAVEVVPVGGL